MKKYLIFMLLPFSVKAVAQDVIVKTDGSTILSKVLEINSSEIKYKKFSNQNGPTYTINKSEIMAINYENGEKDVFDHKESTRNETSNNSPNLVRKKADSRNKEIIALYNRNYNFTDKIKPKNKASDGCVYILGVRPSSIMSNEDIEMTFVREIRYNPNGYDENVYNICLKNKTSKTIYVDKGNCFRIEPDGTFHCYYDSSEQLSVSNGKGSGGSLGLGSVAGVLGVGGIAGQLAGGVTVGGGSSRSVTRTYSQQRIIAIPPYAVRNLCVPNFVKIKGYRFFGDQHSEHETVEDAENFNSFSTPASKLGLTQVMVNKGEVKYFDENHLHYNKRYIITYSTEEDFRHYSSLDAELYIREIIGFGYLDRNEFTDHGIKPEKYIEGVNEFTIFGRLDH